MGSQLLIYIIKRLLVMIPTLFVIALICFIVLNFAPGRPGQAGEAAQASGSEEARNQYRIFRETFNLDKPVLFNTYFWVERSEVRELIDTALDPASSARDNLEARYALEDYGSYIVPELMDILKSAEDPAVVAFTINELSLNGQRRNLFLGTEDDIPDEVEDEQREISRHNRRISEWRVPQHWSIVPEGFDLQWPPTDACDVPLDADTRYCALGAEVEESEEDDPGNFQPSLAIGLVEGSEPPEESDGEDTDESKGESVEEEQSPEEKKKALEARAAELNALAERAAEQTAESLPRTEGGNVRAGDVEGRYVVRADEHRHVVTAVFPLDDGDTVVFVARIPSSRVETLQPSVDRTMSSLEATFHQQVEQRTQQWLAWYEQEKSRFSLDTSDKISAFFTDTRFYKYMSNLAQGDFGLTLKKRPVLPEIMRRAKYTFVLSLLSVVLIYLLSIPIGIFSALRQHTLGDQTMTLVLFILYSLPTFFVGTLIVQYMPEWVPFATSGFETSELKEPYLTTGERFEDIVMHLVFPVLTMTYGGLAVLSRYARTGLLDVIRADYIRTARAKGLSESVVILKHAVRNGMIPILTILGTLLPFLFSGSLVVEFIFEIDGIGRYILQAIHLRDYAVIMGILLISAVMTLIGLLISDISYALVDPRITFD